MRLETPLRGRFIRERVLLFGPPTPYLLLVGVCLLIGLYFILTRQPYWVFVGAMIFFAGIWGMSSLDWLAVDLRRGTYARKWGAGFGARVHRGSVEQLEAIFLLAEERFVSVGAVVSGGRSATYRIVLQWRGFLLPSLVVEQDYRSVPPGAGLEVGAAWLRARAESYARALRLPMVDHSSRHIANPVPAR